MTLGLAQRAQVALDTIKRSQDISAQHEHQGATLDSVFVPEQLPPFSFDNSSETKAKVELVNSDSFVAARNIINQYPEAIGNTAVLNLASDERPGGGWNFTLYKTQEEALCYSSTLFATLKPSYYPWPNLGPGSVAGVFSPGVVVFKDCLDNDCVELPLDERRVVSVITVAAPRYPALTEDRKEFKNPSDLEDLRGKIRLVYRMAAHHGKRYIVLGAMGCGAYACPPRIVAEEMKSILLDPEFRGWFRKIVFAVYSSPTGVGAGNVEVFSQVFEGVEV